MNNPIPEPRQDRLPFSPVIGCLLAVLAGVLCAGVFFAGLWLTQRREIAYAPQPYSGIRLWIVSADEGGGLGLSTTWPVPGRAADRVCAVTTVRFLLASNSAEPTGTSFCECFERTGEAWSPGGSCPE